MTTMRLLIEGLAGVLAEGGIYQGRKLATSDEKYRKSQDREKAAHQRADEHEKKLLDKIKAAPIETNIKKALQSHVGNHNFNTSAKDRMFNLKSLGKSIKDAISYTRKEVSGQKKELSTARAQRPSMDAMRQRVAAAEKTGKKGGGGFFQNKDGTAHVPGPDGADVEGAWRTVKGKRLFFPDTPGGDIPEGPWGGGPGRPGWTRKGGTFVARKGVMPQKGQLSLFGKGKAKAKTEARTYGGRPLSEQLGAYLVEYRTKGWSTTPDKSGKVWKTTPPGKKGVWRTLNGKHVFFPQDGSGPIGGAPGRAGWTKRSGKYHEAGQKSARKTAKTTKRGQR